MEPASKGLLTGLFSLSVRAVHPYEAVLGYAPRVLAAYAEGGYRRLLAVGFGKAACAMAKAFEASLGDEPYDGIVITKYGHCGKDLPARTRVLEAGHPLPDENGLRGAKEIMGLLGEAGTDTLVACLISGGGSALLVSPLEGITLEEKQEITGLLLKAGADINELNTVRKHLSRVKGGRLAELAYPAGVISLILSDVIADRLDVIASGPTAPDGTTYGDAIKVLEKYGLTERVPEGVMDALRRGGEGLLPETPKPGSRVFEKVENIIIGNNVRALEAARKGAEELGFHTEVVSSELTGEAREAGVWLAGKALAARRSSPHPPHPKVCLVSGGETTVTVKGSGKGGRNTELALAFAREIEGVEGIALLSAGTDGNDGPTDAAGAVVDGKTISIARSMGIDPDSHLADNDSYTFFKKAGGLLVTGPTGTNVMDVQIVLIEK
jgi:glycerate 2-kinase